MNAADVIDLTDQLDAIRARYPEYGNHPESSREAAALWGHPHHNEAGVIDATEVLQIELESQKRWIAEIRLARTPNGCYAMDTEYSYPNGGGAAAPSVWNRHMYQTRESAVGSGFDQLIKRFEGVRNWHRDDSHAEAVLAQRMIDRLLTLKSGTRQMTLP
jgi:hypothetical protein